MIGFKLKLALRNLLKDKVNGTLIIGGFAIGFTAFILIGLFYMEEHRVNDCFENAANTYRIYDAKNHTLNLNYDLYPALMNEFPEIVNSCPMEYSGGFNIAIKDSETNTGTQFDQFIATTGEFFDIFSTEVISSLSETPFRDKNSIVLTESAAKKLYGSTNPLGREIQSDWFEGTVSAIIKDIPNSASFSAEVILNTDNEDFRLSQSCNDGKCWFTTHHFLTLNKTADVALLSKKINQSVHNIDPNIGSLAFQKLSEIYLSSLPLKDSHRKGNSKMLMIFLAIGLLIIILSSINYLNYTVSKQYSKLKEIGINKTIGANATSLFSNSFIEVTMGIIISVLLAIGLTYVLLPFTNNIFGKSISFSEVNMLSAILFFLGIILFVLILNSLAPVYVLSKFNITDFLSGRKQGAGKQIGRQTMLTFQLTASIILITVVLFIFKQLDYVKNYNLGFNQEHLIRIDLPYFYQTPSTIKEEIGKLPFVEESALSDGYPGHIRLSMGSGSADKNFSVKCITVSNDYLSTMGIQLVKGRDFHPGDAKKACLLNQEALKEFGWDTYEDKEYKQGDNYRVVGIVKDFNVNSLHSSIEPVAILYEPENTFGTLSVRLAPGNVNQQIADLRKSWKGVLPNEPMYFTFYDQYFQALYHKEERLAKSISFFSLIALALTCMGILGQILLISFTRTKEIGVRKVNGAKISEILSLLNKDFLKWISAAYVIATPISLFAMNKWLENFAYKTELSWWIFALAGILTLGIALLTVSFQSWKAATRNPVEALRYE